VAYEASRERLSAPVGQVFFVSAFHRRRAGPASVQSTGLIAAQVSLATLCRAFPAQLFLGHVTNGRLVGVCSMQMGVRR
jgi:hypothetical protein